MHFVTRPLASSFLCVLVYAFCIDFSHIFCGSCPTKLMLVSISSRNMRLFPLEPLLVTYLSGFVCGIVRETSTYSRIHTTFLRINGWPTSTRSLPAARYTFSTLYLYPTFVRLSCIFDGFSLDVAVDTHHHRYGDPQD